MNRNTVILDGQNKAAPGGSNGILVEKANNVSIENMTARNYDRATPDGGNGNAFWWTGGDGLRKRRPRTAGGASTSPRTTRASTAATGSSPSNEKRRVLGTHLRLRLQRLGHLHRRMLGMQSARQRRDDRKQRGRLLGLELGRSTRDRKIDRSATTRPASCPNGENPGDGPPPQDGMCDAKKPPSRTRTTSFTSTNIARCTIFRKNLITENNNLEAPANPSTEVAPWGVGVELPGVMADEVDRKHDHEQRQQRRARLRVPEPVPAAEARKQRSEEKGVCTKTIYFQLAGNKIANNTFENNGTHGSNEYNSDITLQGGIFPYRKYTSDNNCVSGNTFVGGRHPWPENIEERLGLPEHHDAAPGQRRGLRLVSTSNSSRKNRRSSAKPRRSRPRDRRKRCRTRAKTCRPTRSARRGSGCSQATQTGVARPPGRRRRFSSTGRPAASPRASSANRSPRSSKSRKRS